VSVCLCEGASPNRRDYGRRLCAEEWARFCGRHSCADAIAKYIRSTKYFFTKTFLLAKDKWKSEPDLLQLAGPAAGSTGGQHKSTRRDSGGWLHRHLSLKRKKQQPPVRHTTLWNSFIDLVAIKVPRISSTYAFRCSLLGDLFLSKWSRSSYRRNHSTRVCPLLINT